jgi:hypothetical protein
MYDTSKVRALNDTFRSSMKGGKVMLTRGIQIRHDLPLIIQKVRSFTGFDSGNDPHNEHDFGAFRQGGDQVFWKIDYYDPGLQMGSPDPADPAVTTRVLTIMLAKEY